MARRRIVLRDYTQVREGDTIYKHPHGGHIEVDRDDPPTIAAAPDPGNRVALIVALASTLAFIAGALIF